jgi:hypothetical protein
MLQSIPFGDAELEVDLPDRTMVVPAAAGGKLPPVEDLTATVRQTLANPLGSPRVAELVRPGARVTIAFDDPTVGSFGPVRRIVIEQLLDELQGAGVRLEDIALLCANALHRKSRPEELAHLIGPELVREFGPRLTCHDAEYRDNLVDLGQTPEGYDVEVHRLVAESDLTVYVNAAHNRGFNGGWKSVCVGLSTYRSIRHHHTPTGMSMSLGTNRMHDMLDAMGAHLESKIPGRIFKVDTLLANGHEVGRMFAGSVWETRRAVLEILRKQFPDRRSLAAPVVDVFVYGVSNWSPYSIFATMNPLLTLVSSGLGYLGGAVQAMGKPGCSVIMATPCPDRWDRVHHPSYPGVWSEVLSQTTDADAIHHTFAERYAHDSEGIEKYRHAYGFHPVHAIMACYPLSRLAHVGQVYVAGAEAPELPQHLGFQPTEDVAEALRMAQTRHGADCNVMYIDMPRSMDRYPESPTS